MTPNDQIPAPEAHLGYWLRVVLHGVSQRFARELAGKGVAVAEWMTLGALLDPGQMLPSELADRLRLTRGAISKLVDRLEAKHLVARESTPSDGRSHRLTLTEAGRELTPRLAAITDRNDAAFFDCLSIAERETLRRVPREIVESRSFVDVAVD